MRRELGVRSATLLFGTLALLVSGCGTLSGGRTSQSTLLASPSVDPGATVAVDRPSTGALETVTATAPTEKNATAPPAPSTPETATTKTEVVPVALEPSAPPAPSPPTESPAATPLVSQATAADSMLAQQRGTAEPTPDVQIEEYDPWEPFNEKMFRFNYNLDKYLIKPVAKGYNFIMPDMFQQMIGHGFDNINVVPKLANNLLQWNLKGFGVELGRFLINSTFGIGGLFDIAKQEFKLEKTKVDFGQTLGKWGLGPGPFLVLPLLPPLTVRDGIGYAADGAMDPLSYVLPFIWDRLGMKIGNQINDRSLNLDLFEGFEETTVDMYSAVRNGYLQRRYNLIKGSGP